MCVCWGGGGGGGGGGVDHSIVVYPLVVELSRTTMFDGMGQFEVVELSGTVTSGVIQVGHWSSTVLCSVQPVSSHW